MKKYFNIILFLLFQQTFFAQLINLEDIVKVKFSLNKNEGESFVVAKINIISGWYINSYKLAKGSYVIPSEIKVNKTNKLTVKEMIEPKPIQYIDKDLGNMQSYHKGSIIMKRKILINSSSNLEVTGVFSFQVCDEAGNCLAPCEYPFSL